MSWKDGLSIKNALKYYLFCNIWKDGITFFPKIYFLYSRKMKDDLYQKIHGNKIFSVHLFKCYKYDTTPLPNKQRQSCLQIMHLRHFAITRKDDIHPKGYGISVEIPYWLTYQIDVLERVPMTLCTFMETFRDVFTNCFPVKKTQEN